MPRKQKEELKEEIKEELKEDVKEEINETEAEPVLNKKDLGIEIIEAKEMSDDYCSKCYTQYGTQTKLKKGQEECHACGCALDWE